MITTLLGERRFAALFWTQALSALNDNFVKNALVILVLFQLGSEGGATLVTLAGATLVAPFFLFSALGGELADRFDKGRVARVIKLWEMPVAAIAAVGFLLQSVPLLFMALFLFGTMGALFGPLKYGALPELLTEKELSAGNALVEGATFIAILAGTILGGLAMLEGTPAWPMVVAILAMALGGWLCARLIPTRGPAAPHLVITRNPWVSTRALLGDLKSDRRLWIGGQIVSWFWVVGAVALSLLPALVKGPLAGSESVVTLMLVVFTVGIAAGSLIAAWASEERPNLALVPIGALVMGLAALALASTLPAFSGEAGSALVTARSASDLAGDPKGWALLTALLALAIGGGLFIVPSFAAVQSWAHPERRARVIAAINVLTAGYMTVAGLGVAFLQGLGVSQILLWTGLGLANLAALALVLRAWGKEGVRDLGLFLFKVLFRLEVNGLDKLPPPGSRALIAPNHVSLLDGPLLHTLLPGHAAFAVDTGMAAKWWVRPFLMAIRSYTLDPTRPLATRALVNIVKSGESVVIFPEGRITTTGGLMKVYDGTAMIADKADAWVVPVRIEGLERSPLSYLRHGKVRKALLPKVRVTILEPRKLKVPADLKGKARRQASGLALQDIMVDAAMETAPVATTLFEALLTAAAERDTGKAILEDPLAGTLGYRKLVLGAQVLADKLVHACPGGPFPAEGGAVGLMLPTSNAAAVTFFALQSAGRVPAMINFTAGPQAVAAACRAAKVEVVLTSRAFIEKGKLERIGAAIEEAGARLVMLEDVRARVGFFDKVRGALVGRRPLVRRAPDDPAVILFTSGSEGLPKGVVLSHANLLANTAQCLTRLAANGEDKVCNVLPLFHSFGLTAGLLMPLVGGVPVFLYPTPLHYRIVPEMIYGCNATILFGTDTFLAGYARTAHPYDFHNLRIVMAGAEAVKARTRQLYMDRFGVRILEGYGVTETAPVLAMNTPLANKAGTVGRLSPLMEARFEPVPGVEASAAANRVGRLHVRGPNVMLGYYFADRPGELVRPPDRWHDTGDIVEIDPAGFLTIRGRAKRFAKIGGEMVSLAAVEAAAADAWPAALSVVVALPDARKGERLVLLTTEAKATRAALQASARLRGLAEIALPGEVRVVPSIPLLGAGKPDYAAALRLAVDVPAEAATAPLATAATSPRPCAA